MIEEILVLSSDVFLPLHIRSRIFDLPIKGIPKLLISKFTNPYLYKGRDLLPPRTRCDNPNRRDA